MDEQIVEFEPMVGRSARGRGKPPLSPRRGGASVTRQHRPFNRLFLCTFFPFRIYDNLGDIVGFTQGAK
jgi:hypothetical protein